MAPLWLRFLSVSEIRTGRRERKDKWGRRLGAGWGGGDMGRWWAAVALLPRERPPHPGQSGSLNLVQGGHQML